MSRGPLVLLSDLSDFQFSVFQKLSRQARVFVGSEGGPPAFTPFGQKTKDKKPVAFKKGNSLTMVYEGFQFLVIKLLKEFPYCKHTST